MQNIVTYYAVKDADTGLFYTGERWIILKDRLDVFMVAYADTEQDAINDFDDYVANVQNNPNLVISTIAVETNIIF